MNPIEVNRSHDTSERQRLFIQKVAVARDHEVCSASQRSRFVYFAPMSHLMNDQRSLILEYLVYDPVITDAKLEETG